MRLATCLLLLLTLLAPVASAQGWEWQNPTPHGHGINDIAMFDEAMAIAACNDGVVMRSGDGGRSWSSVFIDTRHLERIAVLENGVAFLSAEDARIYRSTDYGGNWTLQYDGGQSTGGSDIAVVNDSTILVKFTTTLMVITRDRGNSWTLVPTPFQLNNWFRGISVQSPTRWFALGERTMYRSSDEGASWSVDTSYSANGLIRLVWIDSSYGYQLRNGQVMQTRNGGASWKEMNIYGFDANVGICAGPRLGSTVYCLSDGDFVINKSSDDGAHWDISLTGGAFREAYPYALSFASATVGIVAGDGGRILRTGDGGSTWTIVHGAGFLGSIADLHFTTPLNGFALTTSPTVLSTSNGGRRWDETMPSTEFSLYRASMYSATGGYAYARDVRYNTALFSTSDAGRSWKQMGSIPITFDYMYSRMAEGICAVSKDTILIGVSYGSMLRSTNAGVTWDSLFVSTNMRYQYQSGFRVFAMPPQTLIYCGANGIGVSEDFGNTWVYRPLIQSVSFEDVQFFSKLSGVALCSTGAGTTIAKTQDGGTTWQFGNGEGNFLMQFFDEQRGVALASRGDGRNVVRHTSDGGANWTEFPMNERVAWSGWFWRTPDEGWAYGQSGLIRHSNNGGFTGIDRPAPPLGFLLDAIHPSPFVLSRDPMAHIRYTIAGDGEYTVRLELFDSIGRLVTTLADERMHGGAHRAVLNAVALAAQTPSGVFSVRLTVDGRAVARTLLILK
jgi:photosystem II stability/assembly factor-like uncharacterized protein